MRRRSILISVAILAVLAFLTIPWPRAGSISGDSWISVGTYTWRGGKGIYLFKFHPETGKVEPEGLAAGPIWQSNRGSLAGSLPRMIAQIRDGWPHMKAIWKGVQNPIYLATHPNGRYLYTANDNPGGSISAFQIDPASGRLTALNTKSSGGGKPCYVTVDRTGKNLLAANYSGSVAVLPLEADGRLRDASCVLPHSSGDARTAHAHSINVSPDNRFAIATDLGLDQVRIYQFDAETGKLMPHPPFLQLPRDSLPRHFTFHPNGVFGYIVTESSSVITLRWDSQAGALTPIETISALPADFHGRNGSAEIQVHPNGKFLYVSNRGHDSIAVFAIDPGKGTLTPIQFASTQGGPPANFRIDLTGNYLFVANVLTGNIDEFRLDPQTGLLTSANAVILAVAPAAIRLIPAN